MWPVLPLLRRAFFLLLLPALACSVPLIGDSGAPEATPTPLGNTLSFTVPVFRVNLEPGDTVPGTGLRYAGSADGTYEVTIDGLTAFKRSGDSFAWNGVIAPGVIGNFNLRLTTTLLGSLIAAGPVSITVFNPVPVALPELPPAVAETPLHYSNIAVQYILPPGRQLPGTTLVYAGTVEPGGAVTGIAQTMAQFTGSEGYPYFALGDSIVWLGQVNPSTTLRYSLRVAAIDESSLRVAGTAELWVLP